MKIRFPLSLILVCVLFIPATVYAQRDKSTWDPNPNPSKYFLGPTAIPMEKKTGYYQNTYILFNEGYYGVTNWFSIGAGFEFLSTFGTLANPPFRPIILLHPKVGFKVADKLYAGLSGLYINATVFNSDTKPVFGVVMGQVTYGSIENNVTGGVAWGYTYDGIAERPIFTVGGTWRAAKRMSLITENYIIPTNDNEYYPVFMYGMRFLGQKMAFDLGFINTVDVAQIDIIGIPYVSMTVNF